MRILSLDASTKKTGWCIIQDGQYIESGIIDLHTDKNGEHRLCEMMRSIGFLILNKTPDKVFLEETTLASNAAILRVLAQLGGFIKGYCYCRKVPIEMIYPTTWRSIVGIKEGAKVKREELKEQALVKCKELLNLTVPEDEAEACLIALAACNRGNDDEEN